jgi:hypothetical protein
MSTHANGSPVRYKVEITSFIKAEIKTLAKKAALIGIKQAYHNAWLAIEKRLEDDPIQFGECHYHLSNGALRCQIGVIDPVAVEFAIHEADRKVVC